jgi:hypothetical protein
MGIGELRVHVRTVPICGIVTESVTLSRTTLGSGGMILYAAFMCWLIFSEIVFLAIILGSKRPPEEADQSQSGRTVGAGGPMGWQ